MTWFASQQRSDDIGSEALRMELLDLVLSPTDSPSMEWFLTVLTLLKKLLRNSIALLPTVIVLIIKIITRTQCFLEYLR